MLDDDKADGEALSRQAGEAIAEDSDACPLPLAHDRFEEAHWHLHQMLSHYHHPMLFRYSTNAFLHALKSVLDMLRLDLERLGHNEWRKKRFQELVADPLFSAFSKGRDVVVHRGSLINSSRVDLGLFKYDKVKLAIRRDLKTDEPSHSLLARLRAANAENEIFVEQGHPFIGEQLGVYRMYYEPKLSADHDVVTASDLALGKVGEVLNDAHVLLGRGFDANPDGPDAHDVERVNKYRETDENPALISEWDWD